MLGRTRLCGVVTGLRTRDDASRRTCAHARHDETHAAHLCRQRMPRAHPAQGSARISGKDDGIACGSRDRASRDDGLFAGDMWILLADGEHATGDDGIPAAVARHGSSDDGVRAGMTGFRGNPANIRRPIVVFRRDPAGSCRKMANKRRDPSSNRAGTRGDAGAIARARIRASVEPGVRNGKRGRTDARARHPADPRQDHIEVRRLLHDRSPVPFATLESLRGARMSEGSLMA
jgi:hypothetical protein